jgi:hypothetical protein
MKTNRGIMWYQLKADDFLYCRWIFFLKYKGPRPFRFKIKFFSVLINFRVRFLDNVARSDK